MNFSEFDVTRWTRKGNFLNQIDQLIDWAPIEKAIAPHYAPASGLSENSKRLIKAKNSAMWPKKWQINRNFIF